MGRKQVVSVELTSRHASPWERLTEAALVYAEADSVDETAYRRARDALRKAARAYAQGLPSAAM